MKRKTLKWNVVRNDRLIDESHSDEIRPGETPRQNPTEMKTWGKLTWRKYIIEYNSTCTYVFNLHIVNILKIIFIQVKNLYVTV